MPKIVGANLKLCLKSYSLILEIIHAVIYI